MRESDFNTKKNSFGNFRFKERKLLYFKKCVFSSITEKLVTLFWILYYEISYSRDDFLFINEFQ